VARDRDALVALDLPTSPTFVDLFAGGGGLSLGLLRAGWRGLFAVESEPNAFQTLKANLIDGKRGLSYEWPQWLPKEPQEIGQFISSYKRQLRKLRGKIDLLAGGPPCQGFSSAGRRRQSDPRNRLFKHYVEMARIIRPRFLVFENVPGIAVEFDKGIRRQWNPRRVGRPPKTYLARIIEELDSLGYDVVTLHERASDFGIPQTRSRILLLGFERQLAPDITEDRIRGLLAAERDRVLSARGLESDPVVGVKEALSDLETTGRCLVDSVDSPGFRQVVYGGPLTRYQRAMHDSMSDLEAPNSMRLVNHRPETRKRFVQILATCRRGVKLSTEDRERFGILKSSTTPLDPLKPSHTLTSLPDDLIHYSEPRILTVREYARLQSFPDWYEFRGKYTTGEDRRRYEVPRYTQVANAVPPLLAEIVGRVIRELSSQHSANVGSTAFHEQEGQLAV